MVLCCFLFIFLFKQKTAYEMRISDWSSDVCSSDLLLPHAEDAHARFRAARRDGRRTQHQAEQGDAGRLLHPLSITDDMAALYMAEFVRDHPLHRVHIVGGRATPDRKSVV